MRRTESDCVARLVVELRVWPLMWLPGQCHCSSSLLRQMYHDIYSGLAAAFVGGPDRLLAAFERIDVLLFSGGF